MCGICGFWTQRDAWPDPASVLAAQVRALSHRGPDESGVHIASVLSASGDGERTTAGSGARRDDLVGLGHARLSIIDLAGGRQPIPNEDGTVHVICNGEIYNFAALRASLEARGHVFRTRSDSEVLVHLWEDEGERLVDRLRGMYAFVLHDRRQGILFGARDRFGQKPLHYAWDDGADVADGTRFAFASEPHALLPVPGLSRDLDVEALDQFLFYQFVPRPRTLWRSIRQLPPAHSFRLDGEGLRLERYWEPPSGVEVESDAVGDEEHVARVESALRDAVRCHLESDVPIGVFLSGGIDSSLIARLASEESRERLTSYSIGFPGERQDESEFARVAARHAGTEHHVFPFEARHLEARLEALAASYSQPLADPAALPLSYLSEQAARQTKVVFTGDGGDELFGGYEKYCKAARGDGLIAALARLVPGLFDVSRLAAVAPDRLGLRKLRARLAYHGIASRECVYYKTFWESWDRHALYGDELRSRLRGRFEGLDRIIERARSPIPRSRLDEMLSCDQLGYLPDDLLPKTDIATMAHGLEARAPFLDHELAAVAATLPGRLKATSDETKVVLRRLSDRLLPRELVSRRKQGFAVPLAAWFRGELRDWIRDRLLRNSRTVPRYFRREAVERLLSEHESGRRNRASKIYALLFFELWYGHHGN